MYQYIGRCAGKSFKRRKGRIGIIADILTAAGEEAKNLDKVLVLSIL